MKGIAKHTGTIIEKVSLLDCLDGWTLVGGTALAIQLDQLEPRYDISAVEIEEYIKGLLLPYQK